jgi:hypothetical protein
MMRVKLHDLTLVLQSDSSRVQDEWGQFYAPFLSAEDLDSEGREGEICFRLALTASVPPPPAGGPSYRQPDLAVYRDGEAYVIYLPRLGQLRVDPAARTVDGMLVPAALDVYGAFEDINALGLAPLFRRHGRALIHAFAAAHHGRALLLAGDNASGKTTTGLALLAAGWKLIANDAPLLGERDGRVMAFAFPGLLSVHPDALQRLPVLGPLLPDPPPGPARPDWKITFAAQDYFPTPWLWEAEVKAVCLLSLDTEARPSEHTWARVSPAVALGQLLPHSVDRWDQETLDFQIDLLHKLARQAPVYRLHLGPDVLALPDLLKTLLANEER